MRRATAAVLPGTLAIALLGAVRPSGEPGAPDPGALRTMRVTRNAVGFCPVCRRSLEQVIGQYARRPTP